jgi:hypothetical protein
VTVMRPSSEVQYRQCSQVDTRVGTYCRMRADAFDPGLILYPLVSSLTRPYTSDPLESGGERRAQEGRRFTRRPRISAAWRSGSVTNLA